MVKDQLKQERDKLLEDCDELQKQLQNDKDIKNAYKKEMENLKLKIIETEKGNSLLKRQL